MDLLAATLDRWAARSCKRARARAQRLADTQPQRALALFAAAARAGDVDAAFRVGEHYLEGKGAVRHALEAARWYLRAAEAGHLGAKVRLAELHLLGLPGHALQGTPGLFAPIEFAEADHHAALPWALSAAEAGSPEAQAMLAYIRSSGPEELRDADAALSWYRCSAEQDCPQGRLGYAVALMSRAGTDAERYAAREELERAARAGVPAAHYLLGVELETATPRDDAQARRHYATAAEAGDARAQTRLGVLMLEGRGGPADPFNGESWLRRASASGDSDAAALLGDLHARGDEVSGAVRAAHWYRSAAERGHKGACRALGTLCLTGAGVAADSDEAATWFRRAAEAGDADAQAALATLLQAGMVSSQAQAQAPVHEWFERSARRGDPIGAFNYAVCLAEGIGVRRNDEEAVYWLKHAAQALPQAQYWYERMLAEGRGVASR